jgi:membrane associated rhomboid family serine protease
MFFVNMNTVRTGAQMLLLMILILYGLPHLLDGSGNTAHLFGVIAGVGLILYFGMTGSRAQND